MERIGVKDMKKIKSERKLCLICMTEHEVEIVEIIETEIFKNEEVTFRATYEYCSIGDELLETEEMIRANSLAMKDAYREKKGLLTSKEIIKIREKYDISQKDFSEILGWGRATITRYENHQVQDRSNDNVLRKINEDPKWFLEMLNLAKVRISDRAFDKYYHQANELFKKKRNQYLVDSIQAIYVDYGDEIITGKARLNLAKVVEMINYLASRVDNLHKVKLAKMLWFADYLHYKRNNIAISGLVYSSLPMGAVPEGFDHIVLLDGVKFDTLWYGENVAYKFRPNTEIEIKELTKIEIETLDDIILQYGDLRTSEIVMEMHEEDAYKFVGDYCIIPYTFADSLSID